MYLSETIRQLVLVLKITSNMHFYYYKYFNHGYHL